MAYYHPIAREYTGGIMTRGERSKWWRHGEITALSKACCIGGNNLSEILHRKRGVSVARAKLLEEKSEELMGPERAIRWDIWIQYNNTRHPAFFGEPLE
jgi:hypothetical protein